MNRFTRPARWAQRTRLQPNVPACYAGKGMHGMTAETKTTYRLEMCSPGDLRPARVHRPGLRVGRGQIPLPELNAFLHTAVGSDYR